MIWGLIKNWRAVVDVLVVVGVIVFIFLLNPFNFFGSGLQLRDSANLVAQIKDIGQLVTAEYYGEVISSYEEALTTVVDEDSVEQEGQVIYAELKQFIAGEYINYLDSVASLTKKSARKKGRKRMDREVTDEVYDYFRNLYFQSGRSNPNLSDEVLLFVWTQVYNQEINLKRFKNRKASNNRNYLRKVRKGIIGREYHKIKQLYALQSESQVEDYLQDGFAVPGLFVDFLEEYKEEDLSKKDRRVNLAVIGRGWVKAGFDFGALNEQNFVYDEANRAIHFFGFSASILDKDINPWFIPERKVPGFQILTRKNADFEKMQEVKLHAIEKLEHYAKEAGLISQAQQNGEEALKEFFGLIIGEDIQSIQFHRDNLVYLAEGILEGDSTISHDELFLIDTLYKQNLQLIRTEENVAVRKRREKLLREFLMTMKQARRIETPGFKDLKFNYFTRHLPLFYLDTLLDKQELTLAQSLRWNYLDSSLSVSYNSPVELRSNEYWFEHDLQYLEEYNEFVEKLRFKEPVQAAAFRPYPIQKESLLSYITSESDWYLGSYQPGDSIIVYPFTGYRLNADSTVASTVESDRLLFLFESDELKVGVSYEEPLILTQKDGKLKVNNDSLIMELKPSLYAKDYQFYDLTKLHSEISLLENSINLPTISWDEERVTTTDTLTFEIIALRNHLIKENYKYHDLGPASKARKWLDEHVFQGITFSEFSQNLRSRAGRLRQSISELGK